MSELVNYAPADVRALVLPGLPADKTYTFSIQAYRKVDPDVATDGVILSPAVTTSPYKPVNVAAFTGDLTGTIQGRGSLLVVQNLEAVASDAVLSTAEKPALILSYNDAVSRYTVAQASSNGLTSIATTRSASSTAKTALDTYLTGLTPAWNDTTVHTPINPSTFQSAWASFYSTLADLEAALVNLSAGNSAHVQIYQRAASAPALPTVTASYNFTTQALTGLNNGWSTTIPVGTDPIYISTAQAVGKESTTTIAPSSWSAARIMAQNGEPGSVGPSAKLISLGADRLVISYDSSGNPSPSTQTTLLSVTKQNTTAAVTWTVKDLNGAARTPASTYLSNNATGDSLNMTEAQFAAARNGTNGVIITASVDVGGGITLTDSVTIMRLQAGLIGADGKPAITAILTNDSHIVGAGSDGVVSSYTGATGEFKVYSGITDVSSNFNLTTASNPQTLTINYSGRIYTVSGGLDANEPQASVTIRATGVGDYAGVVIDKVFSIAKSTTGATGTGVPGAPAVWIEATKKQAIVQAYADGNVDTFAPAFGNLKVWSGSTDVTATATLSATASNCVGTVNTAANTPVSGQPKGYYQVTALPADNGTLTITATYNGQTFTETFSVSKNYVGYQIVAALPTTNLFNGRHVYLTTDKKLYRYVVGPPFTGWTVDVDGADIKAGSVTSAKLFSTEISAMFATIGVMRTATSGARTEIRDNLILVYDFSNVMRVRLGVWS